ncbi:hypothetical protein [Methylococcus geothermalis]|uniref:Uncharacterized protein n=1 Tax=Methylococcus geothermalis TaxID=2681310 RepID=A0A858Q683_9GAMM|nr:hypothetical protein [Methylococcus geothermalis]QJD29331.1 hypothetical protein GNH96_04690 [Methylococcus geothermalis]
MSSNVIHLYQNISNFVRSSEWLRDITQKGKRFISSTYKHHKIRIYGEELSHSFQLALKKRGIQRYDFREIIDAKGKNTLAVKELAYTALRGTLSESEDEKQLLRNLYRELKSNT